MRTMAGLELKNIISRDYDKMPEPSREFLKQQVLGFRLPIRVGRFCCTIQMHLFTKCSLPPLQILQTVGDESNQIRNTVGSIITTIASPVPFGLP